MRDFKRLQALVRGARLGIGIWIISLLAGCDNAPEVLQSSSMHRFVDTPVVSADLAQDASLMALLTADQQVSVWNTVVQQQVHAWGPEHFNSEIIRLALSGDKQRLAVAGHWSVSLLSTVDGSVITSWDVLGFQASATVSRLFVDHTGHKVLVGMTDGAVLSVDLRTGNALKLDHHRLQVTRLAYDSDSPFALSGSTDKNLAYWEIASGDIAYQHTFRSRITALAVDDASDKLFVSDALTDHWILDKHSGNKLSALSYFERFRFFRHGLFVKNGDYLITTSPKNVVTLWDAASGDEITSWTIKRYTANATVMDLTTNAAGNLVTLSSDGVVQEWDYHQYL